MKKSKEFKQINMVIILSFITVIALAFTGYAEDQVQTEDQIDLKEIVVTASRTKQNIEDTSAMVEIITRKDIDAIGAKTLLEALRVSTGITLNPAMVGAGVSIRGMENRHVLILVDGERLISEGSSSTANVYEWDRINMANVERIEIIRSDASSLYGSDALGGVINVITKKPGKKEFTLSYNPAIYSDYSDTRTDDYYLRYDSGEIGSFAWSISAGRRQTDPLQEPGSSTTTYYGTREFLNLSSSYELSDSMQLGFKADFLDEDMEEQTSVSNMDYFDNSRESYSLELDGSYTYGDYVLRTYFGEQDKQADMYNPLTGVYTAKTNESNRKTWTWEGWNSSPVGLKHLLTTGFELRSETYKGTRVSIGKASNDYSALYAQDEYMASDRLIITPSLRHDNSDKFDSKTTSKLGANYKINENYRLKASIGEGFKAPSLDNMYMYMVHGPFITVNGNPDLKPEESTTYEIAIEGEKGKYSASVSYFINDVKNLITTVNTGAYTYSYENLDKAEINGVETELGRQISTNLSAKITYTYLDAVDGESNERLSDRARHSGTVQLRYDNNKKNGVSVVLWNSWAADYWYVPSDDDPYNKNYNTWNISLNKKWNQNLESYISVDNIFNEKDYDLNIWGSIIRAGFTVKL
ncbi:MAG: TonB-dependent receptor [Firmicutes bacterium]|nr:TonB-dependent receptor [Bacillota bacterium]